MLSFVKNTLNYTLTRGVHTACLTLTLLNYTALSLYRLIIIVIDALSRIKYKIKM